VSSEEFCILASCLLSPMSKYLWQGTVKDSQLTSSMPFWDKQVFSL